MVELGSAYPGLPDDLLNFQYEPVACATAVGHSSATTEVLHLRSVLGGDVLADVI
jgi:hypothetical protein